jgi:YWFCY protein
MKQNSHNWATLYLATSVILITLQIYFYYYFVFERMGWSTIFTDHILILTIRTGLFDNIYTTRGAALVFLFLASWGAPVRKSSEIPFRRNLILLLTGLLVYLLFVPSVFSLKYSGGTALALYSLFTVVSCILIFISMGQLVRRLNLPWLAGDPFGRRHAGFPQEHPLVRSDFSLHLRGEYSWQGQKRKSWINFINPRRGILILGSPGSGKSWFIIESFIRQLIDRQFALFIYDFKYDSLTKFAWSLFQVNRHKYPPNTAFYTINFTDLSRSHRCNVLAPATLNYLSDALGASRTILLSMNKTWAHRQGDFFIESPINFVAVLIWYLRKYRNGAFCTLPHVIELSKVPYEQLFLLLSEEPSITTLIDPFGPSFVTRIVLSSYW